LAARDEFAEHGFSGTRIERVAERAGADKKLVYYYFGTKEALFLQVLDAATEEFRAAERTLALDGLPASEALRRIISFVFEYYVAHPEYIALLNSANQQQARHLTKNIGTRAADSPLIRLLSELLERGRAQGIFRGGIDPNQLFVSISGMAYFYLSNNHTLSAVFERNLMTPKALGERLSHITDHVLGYVMAG